MFRFLISLGVILLFLECTNKQKKTMNDAESNIPVALRPSLEKQPKMVFDQPLVYLGRITEGDSIDYTFHFRNKGNLPLQITSVNASCGCTTPKFQANAVIAPGQKTTVTLGFNGSAMGNFTKNATIFLSDNLIKTVSFSGVGV